MAGRRPLKAGAHRLLGNHGGARGRAFRRGYDALAEEFDLATKLARLEASRVSAAWANLEASTQALEAARTARETGTGRRPSTRDVERLARRHGLDDASYAAAFTRLEQIAPKRSAKPSTNPLRALVASRQADG